MHHCSSIACAASYSLCEFKSCRFNRSSSQIDSRISIPNSTQVTFEVTNVNRVETDLTTGQDSFKL